MTPVLALLVMSTNPQSAAATPLDRLPVGPANRHYPAQRAPLAPSPVVKLPTGAVKAAGWLKVELDLQRDGYSGRLPEISKFLDPKNNAWMGTGSGERAGWEELPYWLKGQVSLAYVTGDKKLIAEVRPWIDAVLASQKPDGWFGPEANRKTKLGTPDLWPNMLMQSVLQTYFEATGDKCVLPFLLKYCDYLISLSDKELIDPRHYWHYHRVGDQLASLVWLYNRTGDTKILGLAASVHKAGSDWVGGIPNRHGVNFAQGFREPATWSVFSRSESDRKATERDLKAFRDEFGQAPGGMYAADENARPGKTDPRQAAESCAVVEMMFSHELLFLYSGDPAWADKAEDVAFNWMPVTTTPDLKALRYLQSPNMTISDARSKSPGVENGGPMFLMDPNDHRCCQHNVGMGWPYFTEHLWAATAGDGLLAAIYAPSEVTAKVGAKGTVVKVTETTDYPFSDGIEFLVEPASPVRFPLSFRVPGWCQAAALSLNGRKLGVKPAPGGFVRIDRTWKKGDKVGLRLPMEVEKVTWPARDGTLSVTRGPLAYSLKIGEKYVKVPRANGWDAFEIEPTTAWNYGLDPDAKVSARIRPLKEGVQPFTPDDVPVSLTVKGRRIPEWGFDMYGLTAPLQACPALTKEPVEDLVLIPMGAARLRVTVFPTVTDGTEGHTWVKPREARKPIPTTYSHRNFFDSESAPSDGLLPASSDDEDVPRFTWWDHKGTEEWLQYTFEADRTFQSCRVFWFDDGPRGGCRVPASWKVQVKVAGAWTDVVPEGPYPVVKDGWSEVKFRPLAGREVRLVVKLQDGFSSGVLEWQAG